MRGVREHRLVLRVRVQGSRPLGDRVVGPEQLLRSNQGVRHAFLSPHGREPWPGPDHLAVTRAAAGAGAVYNVGTGVQTSLREVVDIAKRVLAIRAEPQWGSMPNRRWDTTVWVADNRKLREELAWQPAFTFEAGFRRM